MVRKKSHLSVAGEDTVTADPEPERAELMTVFQAAENGTRLDELRAMRAVLAKAIDAPDTSARDLAALTRRQLEISREIESLLKQAKEEAEEASKGGVTKDEQWRPEAI